ncbi:Capsid protein VP4 [Popillia japonica]|uniref:Capsid protein VP4 n=1 Tax=Popillia japonica TaxID=7064 RepID=A0AAW1JH21_POPJA
MVTPLATLPVDMIGFHMDYAEANMIFGKIKILQTNVTVVPQGIRTAFDYGTTLSGTATSEHCSIGCSGIGLNNQLYCTHGAITSTSDKPMIPTDISDINPSVWLEKFYGKGALTGTEDEVPMILGVPRHAHMYFALRQTNDRVPDSTDRSKYPINECGCYKPVNGIIQWKRHFVPYDTNDSDTAFNMASNGTTLPVKTTIKNYFNTNTKRLEDKRVRYDVDFEEILLKWAEEVNFDESDIDSDDEYIPTDYDSESEAELAEEEEEEEESKMLSETSKTDSNSNYLYGKNRFK